MSNSIIVRLLSRRRRILEQSAATRDVIRAWQMRFGGAATRLLRERLRRLLPGKDSYFEPWGKAHHVESFLTVKDSCSTMYCNHIVPNLHRSPQRYLPPGTGTRPQIADSMWWLKMSGCFSGHSSAMLFPRL
jgi:hypothetical protein